MLSLYDIKKNYIKTGALYMKTTSVPDPSELKVKGWNWGPLIFTFVWAIFHGFWVLGIL